MFNYILKSPHRNILEEKLKELAPKIKGKILDAGSKNSPYRNFFEGEVVAIDIEPKTEDVKKGDITHLDFPPNSFDSVLSTEVFEYIKMSEKGISEIYRVLKKDGFVLISVPFMYKIHRDFVRYTKDYLLELFSIFSNVEIFPIGNFYTIILDILRDKIVHLKPSILRYILYFPYLFLVLFIKPSKALIKDQNFVSGYIVLAKK